MAKKIYIIEDDANILYSLQAKFSTEGFEVKTDNGVGHILEIVNHVKMFIPQILVLDLILPKFDGFDLLHEFKRKEETKNIPIFVFTNLSDEDSKSRGLNLGADYYFIKDEFSIDQFVAKVKKIIENKEKMVSQ